MLGRQAPQMVSLLVLRRFALFDLSTRPQAFVVAVGYAAVVLALLGAAFRRQGPPVDAAAR